MDEEDLLPGQDWQYEIPRAVQASDIVIVCLSRNAVTKRGYVQKEIRFALDVADEQPEGKMFVIPLRLEECEVPSRLSRWQWVNLYEEAGYQRLLRALSLGSGTPAVVPRDIAATGPTTETSVTAIAASPAAAGWPPVLDQGKTRHPPTLSRRSTALLILIAMAVVASLMLRTFDIPIPRGAIREPPIRSSPVKNAGTREPVDPGPPTAASESVRSPLGPDSQAATNLPPSGQPLERESVPTKSRPSASAGVTPDGRRGTPGQQIAALLPSPATWKVEGDVVIDEATKLMWTRGDFKTIVGRYASNWDEVMHWATDMNMRAYAGHTDWQVASIAEYRTIRKPSWREVFLSDQEDLYWSRNEINKYVASFISFDEGYAVSGSKTKERKILQPGEFWKMSARLVRRIE